MIGNNARFPIGVTARAESGWVRARLSNRSATDAQTLRCHALADESFLIGRPICRIVAGRICFSMVSLSRFLKSEISVTGSCREVCSTVLCPHDRQSVDHCSCRSSYRQWQQLLDRCTRRTPPLLWSLFRGIGTRSGDGRRAILGRSNFGRFAAARLLGAGVAGGR
jgi:hypothetical protein